MIACFILDMNDKVMDWEQNFKSKRVVVAYHHEQQVITPPKVLTLLRSKSLPFASLISIKEDKQSLSTSFLHTCSPEHALSPFRLLLRALFEENRACKSSRVFKIYHTEQETLCKDDIDDKNYKDFT